MAKELVFWLREHMGTFGVLDKLALDGTLVYKSTNVQEFLARFRIRHRLSSAYNPHFNQLAEGAVKSTKRTLKDNRGAGHPQQRQVPHRPAGPQEQARPRDHPLQQLGGVRQTDQGPPAPPAREAEGQPQVPRGPKAEGGYHVEMQHFQGAGAQQAHKETGTTESGGSGRHPEPAQE